LLFSTTTGHPMNEAPRKTSRYVMQLPANIPTQSPCCKPDSRRDLEIVLPRRKSSRYVRRSFCHGKTSAVRSPKTSAWISASAPRVAVQRVLSVGPEVYDSFCNTVLLLARVMSVTIVKGFREVALRIKGSRATSVVFLDRPIYLQYAAAYLLPKMPRSVGSAAGMGVVRTVSMPGPHPCSVVPTAYHL